EVEHDTVLAVLALLAAGIESADAFAAGGGLRPGGRTEHRGRSKGDNCGFRFHGVPLLFAGFDFSCCAPARAKPYFDSQAVRFALSPSSEHGPGAGVSEIHDLQSLASGPDGECRF